MEARWGREEVPGLRQRPAMHGARVMPLVVRHQLSVSTFPKRGDSMPTSKRGDDVLSSRLLKGIRY
jgi:hypothetical protein